MTTASELLGYGYELHIVTESRSNADGDPEGWCGTRG